VTSVSLSNLKSDAHLDADDRSHQKRARTQRHTNLVAIFPLALICLIACRSTLEFALRELRGEDFAESVAVGSAQQQQISLLAGAGDGFVSTHLDIVWSASMQHVQFTRNTREHGAPRTNTDEHLRCRRGACCIHASEQFAAQLLQDIIWDSVKSHLPG